MFRLVLLSALAAVAFGQNCCSLEDRKEVLNLWESVWSAAFTGRRVAIAQAVFAKLFEKKPDSKALFTRVKVDEMGGPDFRAHVIRVTNGLDTCINLSYDPEALDRHLFHLNKQHMEYEGIRQEYFTAFREAFAEVLPQAIPCFNSAAWNRCLLATHQKMTAGMAP